MAAENRPGGQNFLWTFHRDREGYSIDTEECQGLREHQFQFEWDDTKAAANLRKHGIPFELASSIFNDPGILTLADTAHSESEERWFSIGLASTGVTLAVAYLWTNAGSDWIGLLFD